MEVIIMQDYKVGKRTVVKKGEKGQVITKGIAVWTLRIAGRKNYAYVPKSYLQYSTT
jgi:hypothetical protein